MGGVHIRRDIAHMYCPDKRDRLVERPRLQVVYLPERNLVSSGRLPQQLSRELNFQMTRRLFFWISAASSNFKVTSAAIGWSSLEFIQTS